MGPTPMATVKRIGMGPRDGSRVWRGRGGGREHLPLSPTYPHPFPLSLLYPLPLAFLPSSFLPPPLPLASHPSSLPFTH